MLSAERLRGLLRYDPLTGNLHWLVDRCAQVKAGDFAGTQHIEGYIQLSILGRVYLAHRIIWVLQTGSCPAGLIDHKNSIRSDNRWENLRAASRSQNATNAKLSRRNTSGVKGVHWSKCRSKWVASIRVNGRTRHLGVFDDLNLAAKAFSEAAAVHYGEFARVA